MININELRLNNFILNEDDKILQVNISNISEILNNPEKYKPIILTEKILKLSGFKMEEIDAPAIAIWNEWYFNGFEVHSSGTDESCREDFCFPFFNNVKVKYIHHLQNLYFNFYGQEIELIIL